MNEVDCMVEPWPLTPRPPRPILWVNAESKSPVRRTVKTKLLQDADIKPAAVKLWYKGNSHKAIGAILGITPSRISRVLKGVL